MTVTTPMVFVFLCRTRSPESCGFRTWVAAVQSALDAQHRKGSWFRSDGDLLTDLADDQFDPGEEIDDQGTADLPKDAVLALPVLVDREDAARGLIAPTTTGGSIAPVTGQIESRLEALANIINLVKSALAAGVQIKTLSFAHRTTEEALIGLPELRAHNATHGKLIKRNPSNQGNVVALTMVNRHALTFRFEHSNGASVFFSSDSDLDYASGEKVPLADGAIVTVPHHGSKDNDSAYPILQAGTRPRVWVRSDTVRGSGKARPTRRYLELTDLKFCTRCNTQRSRADQTVRLIWEGEHWLPHASTLPCSCRT